MPMPGITVVYAVLLIALGFGGYFGFGRVSITAMIPAFFGVVVLVTGLLGYRDRLRKHAMHAAAALGLIGFLATVGGWSGAYALLTGDIVARPAAAVSRSIMALLSLGYFLLCLKSFIAARRAQKSLMTE